MPPTVLRGQQIYTTTDTTNKKYNISDVIDLLSPTDVPLLTLVGKDSLKFPCDQITHEWLEDELRPRVSTLAAAYVAGSGSLTVASNAGRYFSIDDLILIDANVLQILAGPPDSDTFVVVGGVGGSTDANAAISTAVTKIAPALPEGSVSRQDTAKTVIVKPYNYTQIFRDQCIISGTMANIARYGYVSERAYQEEKVLRQLSIDMEFGMLYGVRSLTEGPPRRSSFGGLFEYLYLAGVSGAWDTVLNNGGNDFTEIVLNNILQQVWEQGGMPDTIAVNGFNKRQITAWATPRIRTERSERMAGASIGTYESEFGTLEIILDRWLRAQDVLILTRADVGLGPLTGRAFSSREVPSLGDYTQTEVLGEYTMEVHRASMSHAWIYNTSTS